MKEQTKTIRVRCVRPFYISREQVAVAGEEYELPTDIGMAAVHGGKAVRLTAAHVEAAPPEPPAVDVFRTPDHEKRAPSKRKAK